MTQTEQERKITLEDFHRDFLTYVREDVKWKQEDKEWKELAEPALNVVNNFRGAAKVFGWIVGFCLGVSAVFGAAKYVWVFFTNPLNKTE